MARSIVSLSSFPRRSSLSDSLKGLFFVSATFVLLVYLFIFFYVSSTLKLVIDPHQTHLYTAPKLSSFKSNSPPAAVSSNPIVKIVAGEKENLHENFTEPEPVVAGDHENIAALTNGSQMYDSQLSRRVQEIQNGTEEMNRNDVFHDREFFLENYKEMNSTLKIYVYPHKRNDPFRNILSAVNYEPGGNYASEHCFKRSLMQSHFITKNPSEADLFLLPFSIANLRTDRRVGVAGIPDFIKDYVYNISHQFPYWNRTGGADHFYLACHSIGKAAMEKATQVRGNAIQLVCSANYFLQGYIPHKDASVPQIWPRQGNPPNQEPSNRKQLAFYAGAMNSRVREHLVTVWKNDSEIKVHQNRLKTPYHESLLRSRFCIHAKGFEVNTARIGDAIYYGCVPVILADHYDLPFADIINWKIFSVVVPTIDIPNLKNILKEIDFDEYVRLQKNVMKVRNHFQWHHFAADYDAFYMVMYELWLRRSSMRVSL